MEHIETIIPGTNEITFYDIEQLTTGILYGFGLSVFAGLLAWGITLAVRFFIKLIR